jgi:hypothetical protein
VQPKRSPAGAGHLSFCDTTKRRLAANLRAGHVAKRVAHTTALAQGRPAFAFDHDLVAVAVIGSGARANRSANASTHRCADWPADRKAYARTYRRARRRATDRVRIGARHARHHNKSCKGCSSHQYFPHLFVSFVSL